MNGTKAKLRKLERYEIAMEQFQRWLVEFPDLLHALRTLQAHVDGESLNAGTPLGLEHCSINGLREQLRRSKRQAAADTCGSAKAGERNVPAVPDGYAVSYRFWDGWPICASCQTGNQNGPLLEKIERLANEKCTRCGAWMLDATQRGDACEMEVSDG